MKIYCFTILFLSSVCALGQTSISYSEVIKTDSVGIESIFLTISDWFATNYNSAKDVIQLSEKESGIIIGKGSIPYSYNKLLYACYSGYIEYTIKIYCKENRYKVDLLNFRHRINIGNNSSCELGLITSETISPDSGPNKSFSNKVWNDIKSKIEVFSFNLIKSLTNTTKDLKANKLNNDF